MADFPLLKTGAVAQYPLQRSVRYRTDGVLFLDGSQQKYRLYGAGSRRWMIDVNNLDDAELAALTAFLEAQGTTPFAFTDPSTSQSVARCVIADDRFEAGAEGELQGHARVVIQEIP